MNGHYNQQEHPPLREPQNLAPKKNGCMKAIAIMILGLLILVSVGAVMAYRSYKSLITTLANQYTENHFVTLPTPQITDEALAMLLTRVQSFSNAIQSGSPPKQELILTADELNALIQHSPSWSYVSGKLYVKIQDNLLHGDASFPLDPLAANLPGTSPLKGRWLNGSGVFNIDMAAGQLLIFVQSLEVQGKPLPTAFLAALQSKNLAEEANRNPKIAAIIDKIESIQIIDNKIHIKGK